MFIQANQETSNGLSTPPQAWAKNMQGSRQRTKKYNSYSVHPYLQLSKNLLLILLSPTRLTHTAGVTVIHILVYILIACSSHHAPKRRW